LRLVRPLALFDPPIDPGMLVKAAAAGIDIGSIVSGLNQPVGPVRCLIVIQKALELCGERAAGESYCIAHHLKVDGDNRTLMLASIRYLDQFVQQDGVWLFAERKLMVDWTGTRISVP
jgi:hypothetical protein